MNVALYNQSLSSISADLALEFVTPTQLASHPLNSLLTQAGFKAESEQSCTLHEHRLIVCGINEESNENYRAAMGLAIKTIMNYTYTSLKVSALNEHFLSALVEGVLLGGYKFDTYKSEPKKATLKEIFFANDSEADFGILESIFNQSITIAKATNFVRDLVNQTPYDMTPQAMAVTADMLASNNDLECTILDVNGLESEGMNAMLAVGRASSNPPRLIHLAYKPANPKKIITLVGKGLTYDSGGLSLKAAASLVTIKMDKAGGCAVMGIIKAVSELKLDI